MLARDRKPNGFVRIDCLPVDEKNRFERDGPHSSHVSATARLVLFRSYSFEYLQEAQGYPSFVRWCSFRFSLVFVPFQP